MLDSWGALQYDEPTTLSLHKIKKVEPEECIWQKLPEIDDSGFGLLDTGRFKAVVKFTEGAAEYVNDRIWSEDQVIEVHGDDIILTFTTSSRPELISWVLSFGSQAELIEPEDVRSEIREIAKKMTQKYK